MANSVQAQTVEIVQITFVATPCDDKTKAVYLSDFNKLITGIVQIHDCLAMQKYGNEHFPKLELSKIQMNSPINFSLNVLTDLVKAFTEILKIPYELIKAKLGIEKDKIEIEKILKEAQIVDNQSQHQQYMQSLEIQDRQLDLSTKHVEFFAFAHAKTQEIITSFASLENNPQAGQLLAPLTRQTLEGIQKITESHMTLDILEIKPIYKDSEVATPKQLISESEQINS